MLAPSPSMASSPLDSPSPSSAASDSSKLVLVVGATGQTGRRLVSELRARGYRVLAGVRDLKKAQGLGLSLDKGVQLVEADVLKPDQLKKAFSSPAGKVDAVVCATGYVGFNPSGFGEVDETGSLNLIAAAKEAKVDRFVLLTSLLTNAPAVGQADNPNYKFLNLFGAVLDHKLVAEKALRASGITWTIVRPGGLSNDPPKAFGNLYVSGEDTLFGTDDVGSEISRDLVAKVLAASLSQQGAENKVFEIVQGKNVPVNEDEGKWFNV
jgi:uncharacterized protein YbjT (DUF2867 family)